MTTPLVIVGHGTRSAAGVAQFVALTRRVASRAALLSRAEPDGAEPGGFVPGGVEGGLIELARPTVGEAVSRLVGDGGGRPIVAVPLVLTAAGHGKGDIPASLVREQVRHPGLSYTYGRPLGPHPVLQELLADRIDAVTGGADRGGLHVVLVGRGSTDPDANAEIAKVARLLWEGRGYAGVEPCFISLAEPSVPAALDKVLLLRARRIVVAPYFLFAGVLPDRIVEQSTAWAAVHPEVDVRVADLIGDCDALADLVLERYREALAGDIRMNCDTCAYRIALPGFEDKVGRPQTPHHHPDEDDHDHPHSHDHPHPHAHDHDHQRVPDHAGAPAIGAGPDDGAGAWQVALVGAGPAAGLITVRGARYLAEADVVVTDRLVAADLLEGLKPGALIVGAGKIPHGPSASQHDINAALVEHARAGRRVVRLKGGDPYVFGRGFEEVEFLRAAGIEPVVVPGVTSAIAGPALAGIPVTHRGVAHELVVVSGHLPPDHPGSLTDWAAIARLRGTVVLLMAVLNGPAIAATLLAHGRPADTPVAVIERAGDEHQRVVTGDLGGLADLMPRVRPPAVIVIGPLAAAARPGAVRPDRTSADATSADVMSADVMSVNRASADEGVPGR